MGNFDKGGRGGFRGGDRGGDRGGFRGGDRGGRSSFGGRGGGRSERPEMHNVICDKCGKNCQVPFKPSSDKPVFCDECFGGKRDGGRDNFRGGDRNSFSERGPKKEYSAPIHSNGNEEIKKHFSELNAKLDKLIFILEKSSNTHSTPAVKTEVKKEITKVVTKKPVAKKVVAKKKK